MKLRIFLPLAILAAFCVGCSSTPSSTTTADNSKPAAADSTKPAADDSTKPADDSKPAADASGDSVVGSWTTDDKSMQGLVITFGADGSVDATGEVPMTADTKAGADMKATYKMDGDKMAMHFVSMVLTPPANADAKTTKAIDDQNKAMLTHKEPDETDKIAFTDKDTFTSTDPKGKVTTFKRKA